MTQELTDRAFWKKYWDGQKMRPVVNPFFTAFLSRFPKAPARFIEVGGYPGLYSAYFKAHHGYEVSLVDFIESHEVVAEVERRHGFKAGSIHCLHGDFMTMELESRFDVVFSAGFLEHFVNYEEVFARHVRCLAPGGTLFISVPNFRGISGWLQKFFDPENYRVHHLGAMDPQALRRIAEGAGLTRIDVRYHGIPHLWLESTAPVGAVTRRLVALCSAVLERMPWLGGRFFAPFVVLMANKPAKDSVNTSR